MYVQITRLYFACNRFAGVPTEGLVGTSRVLNKSMVWWKPLSTATRPNAIQRKQRIGTSPVRAESAFIGILCSTVRCNHRCLETMPQETQPQTTSKSRLAKHHIAHRCTSCRFLQPQIASQLSTSIIHHIISFIIKKTG